jgi:hypothetical protein
MAEKEALENNLRILIEGLKILDVPLLLTEQYPKGLGKTIPFLGDALADAAPIEKIEFSCCDNRAFRGQLSGPVFSGRKTVIIAGIESHVCVLQTTVDFIQDGYNAVLVTDCISSRKQSDKETAIRRLQAEGAVLSSYESILFELCRSAGTDLFKSISRLVK